jgi:hypothetical protein
MADGFFGGCSLNTCKSTNSPCAGGCCCPRAGGGCPCAGKGCCPCAVEGFSLYGGASICPENNGITLPFPPFCPLLTFSVLFVILLKKNFFYLVCIYYYHQIV